MPLPKLTKLELRIMETLWSKGASSIRELLEAFPEKERLAYTTVQTVVYRLEEKKAVRRTGKTSNAHVFEAVVSRSSAQHRMIDDLVALFGGKRLPLMTHLIESGRLTPEEIREARKALRNVVNKGEKKGKKLMIPSSLQPLVNHLWQSTLFAACAALLTLVLRRNRAQTRYGLWLVASAKFLIPFSVLVEVASRFGRHPAAAIMPSALPPMIQRASQPFALPASLVTLPAAQAAAPSVMPAIFLAVWAIGFAAIVFSWWRRWRNLSATVRTATPLDLPIGVKVMSSPAFPEPGVFGVLRPVLLLPEGIISQLTAPQLESVLAHEMCHIRRRDNLATAMHMVVEAMFWFHPLVWWLGARLIGERERACDEEVLRMGNEPAAYAEGILKVCELYLESPLPCVAGVTGANLRQRIEEIMTRRIAMNLDSRRKLLLALAGVCVVAGPLLVGLSADSAGPKFEVASVRPCADYGRGRGDTKLGPAGGSPQFSPGRLNTGCALLAANYPMSGLIQRVYGRLKLGGPPPLGAALPVSGGPKWIYSDYYVINAETAEKASTDEMKGPMLQALLEDRFKLKVHRETRQVPVYVLTVAKGGSKLQHVAQGSCVPPDNSTWPMPALPPGKHYCVSRGAGGRKGPNTTIHEDEATVDYICKMLQLVMDRPVVDKTGLTGLYKVDLVFAIDQSTPNVIGPEYAQPSDDPPAPSIFTVMQGLGLKLEATKGPRDFLVIDHVERPTAN